MLFVKEEGNVECEVEDVDLCVEEEAIEVNGVFNLKFPM